jgi:phage-related protein
VSFNAGSIEADLTLSRSDWLKDLKKTKAEIADLEKTNIVIGVDLDDDNAKIAMDNLELFLDDLDNSTYTPDADLNTTPANEALDRLLVRLEEFDSSRYTATLDADGDNLMVALSNAELFLEDFDGKHADATIGLDSAAFKAERDILIAQIDELDAKSVDIDVDVDDTTEALAELAELQAAVTALDHQTVKIDVDYDEPALKRLVGDAGGGGGGGGYMSFWALLIKGIIALSPVLSAAVGAMAGAIVGYSAALVGAAGPALVLAGGIAALIYEFNSTAVADRTPEMQAFADALDSLKDAYEGVIPLIQASGFDLMAKGLDLAAQILPTLVPLFNAAADAMGGVLDGIAKWVDSPEYDEMIDFFSGFGVDMLVQWLDIFGNVIQFFGRLFDAAAPFARVMMDGLEEVTQGWADWADNLDKNQAFIDFMNEAIEKGPMILDMLGSLLGALINIGKALEPFAGPMIEGLTMFFDLIANMDPGQLSILIGIGAALYTLVQVAPLIIGLVDGLGAFAAVLGIGLGPLALLIGLVGGLAYVIYHLWQTNEDFRDGILDTWHEIEKVVGPIIEDITNLIRDNWGPISKWAEDIWENVQEVVTNAFIVIEQVIRGYLKVIEFIWTNFGDNILDLAKDYFGGLGEVIGGAFEVLSGLWEALAGLLTGDWEKMFDGLGKITEGGWKMLEGLFKMGWAPIKFAWEVATGLIGKAWDTTMDFLRTKWNEFRTWIGQKWADFKGWVDKWTVSPSELWTAIKTKWNDTKEWVKGKWDDFKGWVKGWAVSTPDIWDAIKTKWGDVNDWVHTKWGDFKDWVRGWAVSVPDMWDAVKNKFTDAKDAVVTAWTNFKTAVSGWTVNASGMFDGFKTAFRSVMNSIIGLWNNLSFSVNIPDKIPGLPSSFTVSTPNVGYLAQGGYITDPGLFVVGEGGEPEIVTPESKMQEIVAKYSGSKIDYSAMASAIATALRGIMGEQITRDDIDRLIREAGINISFDRTDNENDFRNLMFEFRRLGFGGL